MISEIPSSFDVLLFSFFDGDGKGAISIIVASKTAQKVFSTPFEDEVV
jgi:hypothetical protein